jgi:hypothetical protein
MRIWHMIVWARVIGLVLSVVGGVMGVAVGVGPDSVGGTIAGQIAGVLSLYHMWAWATITPIEYWFSSAWDIPLTLLLPAVDWALLVFATLWVVGRFRRHPA